MPDPTSLSGLSRRRIEAIDWARGIAIVLMILSHGVKGLLSFEQIPNWGLVPIHLLTKFSSTLFILVFGVSLAIVYLPYVGRQDWPERRLKLLIRGLKVLFWYKALTIVEMAQLYSREDVLAALTYQAFPVYVEILGFYGIALLWMPFFLTLWSKLSMPVKILSPVLTGLLAIALTRYFDFFGSESMRAILVEHDAHYTWGQLSRAPTVFAGLLIGEALRNANRAPRLPGLPDLRQTLAVRLAALGGIAFCVFFVNERDALAQAFAELARNEGKHPPDLTFTVFSTSGALLILAIAIAGGNRLAAWTRPITAIGKDSLQAFICHIVILFVFYRYLFDYWQSISYPFALQLSLIMVLVCSLWVSLVAWVRKHS